MDVPSLRLSSDVYLSRKFGLLLTANLCSMRRMCPSLFLYRGNPIAATAKFNLQEVALSFERSFAITCSISLAICIISSTLATEGLPQVCDPKPRWSQLFLRVHHGPVRASMGNCLSQHKTRLQKSYRSTQRVGMAGWSWELLQPSFSMDGA